MFSSRKKTQICFPTAKINFGLNIVGKRSDGYHNIESVFYPIGICDSLEIELNNGASDIVTSGNVVDGNKEDNLVWKTWQTMQRNYSLPHLQIRLVKHIPMGGGVGGGSADVGFFINVVDSFFELNLTQIEKEAIALQIGSDCPFFIENRPKLVQGRGEKLMDCPNFLNGQYLVLFFDAVHISTKEAYAGIRISESKESLLGIIQDTNRWKDEVTNDFEKVVFEKYPSLGELKSKIYKSGSTYASLSGTGGCMYGIYHLEPKLPAELNQKVVWKGILT